MPIDAKVKVEWDANVNATVAAYSFHHKQRNSETTPYARAYPNEESRPGKDGKGEDNRIDRPFVKLHDGVTEDQGLEGVVQGVQVEHRQEN